MTDPLLSLSGLTKRYAVTVLDDVEFDLQGGEIHALLGSNGAGKSTMCRIIAGLTPPTSGSMRLGGHAYLPSGKQEAEQCGVQIVQQELCLIPTLSVAENMMLSRLPQRLGIIHRGRLRQQARIALDRVELRDIDPDVPAGRLGVGQQQLVEIATALDRQCRVLILDEPTSSLSGSEAENLFRWLLRLRDEGIGILYISHRLDEVAQLADRVTVLRDGRRVCTRATEGLSTDEMVSLMTGESPSQHAAESFRSHRTDRVALRAENFTRDQVVRDVSFHVHEGERLGIAGLVGAGRSELLRLIFGADPADAGFLRLGDSGSPLRFNHPHEAVDAGLAMVTEDRKSNGLLLPLSIRINASIASLSERFARGGLVRRRAEREIVSEVVNQLDVRCRDLEQAAVTLSGGNQQKVAIAKWLVREADIFLFDEPTRGIDVASRRRIYRLIDSLAAEGKAIVMVSSDLDELLETCDRIAVMSAGRMVATFSRGDWSVDRIMQAAFSGHMGSTA